MITNRTKQLVTTLLFLGSLPANSSYAKPIELKQAIQKISFTKTEPMVLGRPLSSLAPSKKTSKKLREGAVVAAKSLIKTIKENPKTSIACAAGTLIYGITFYNRQALLAKTLDLQIPGLTPATNLFLLRPNLNGFDASSYFKKIVESQNEKTSEAEELWGLYKVKALLRHGTRIQESVYQATSDEDSATDAQITNPRTYLRTVYKIFKYTNKKPAKLAEQVDGLRLVLSANPEILTYRVDLNNSTLLHIAAKNDNQEESFIFDTLLKEQTEQGETIAKELVTPVLDALVIKDNNGLTPFETALLWNNKNFAQKIYNFVTEYKFANSKEAAARWLTSNSSTNSLKKLLSLEKTVDLDEQIGLLHDIVGQDLFIELATHCKYYGFGYSALETAVNNNCSTELEKILTLFGEKADEIIFNHHGSYRGNLLHLATTENSDAITTLVKKLNNITIKNLLEQTNHNKANPIAAAFDQSQATGQAFLQAIKKAADQQVSTENYFNNYISDSFTQAYENYISESFTQAYEWLKNNEWKNAIEKAGEIDEKNKENKNKKNSNKDSLELIQATEKATTRWEDISTLEKRQIYWSTLV